jgi:hypothetical protein
MGTAREARKAMKQMSLRQRQIHLDFHTGPAIPEVGADFDARAFARTMKRSHVNSVTVFAKCHHGHLYYATRRPARHPGLEAGLDLTGKQVAALHAEGIRAPIYISVLLDEYAANTHPEWIARSPDGSSGLDDELRPVLPEMGVTVQGWSPFRTTYIRFGPSVAEGVPATEHVMYERGIRVKPARGATEVTVMRQGRRTVVHLLQFVEDRRTDSLDLVEDIIPLYDVPLSLRTAGKPKRAYLAPSGLEIELTFARGRTSVLVPEVAGHQMVVFE